MIGVKEAYIKAQKEFPDFVLVECVDIGSAYAFYFAPNPTETIPGVPYVAVNKNTGTVTYLEIPPFSNLALIQSGKRLDINTIKS